MSARAQLTTLTVLLLAGAAQAQAQSGEAACAEVMARAMEDCAVLTRSQAERKSLSDSGDEKVKSGPRFLELTIAIARLESQPLLKVNGFCESINTETLRTCNALATRLSTAGGVPELARATKQSALLQDEQLADEASAPDRQTATNKAGSLAQLEPVESIQPITLAGGAVTLAGTRSGTKGVATITVNPLALALPGKVTAGRLFDLSVSAPFDLDRGTSENRRYVSARLRLNLTAPISSAPLEEAVSKWLNAEGRYAGQMDVVLRNAADLQACVDAIAKNQQVREAECKQRLDTAELDQARAQAFAEIARAQRAADRYYFGIDARFDTGDPTGPDITGDKGTHMLGGLAAGIRLPQGALWDWELRGRLAGDYFLSRDAAAGADPGAVYSFDWGAAFIFSGHVQDRPKQRMAFGIGMEGRHAKRSAAADLSPTNYVRLNIMTVIPAMSGGDFGLALGIPIADSRIARGAVINFSTDLGLLDHGS